MNSEFIICHYDEIGLKGKNRKFFEDRLMDNIRRKLPGEFKYAKRISGRIIVKLAESADENKIKEVLKDVFGLAYFTFAVNCEQEMETVKTTALKILSEKNFETFRISSKRSKKDFPITSQEINERVGGHIVENMSKKVKLNGPDATLFIEIVENFAFLYIEKFKGPGGLPTGVSGKVISLLSGGIDSPVATYYILKRGATAVFVHFHSLPFTSPASLNKTRELASILDKFQNKSRLYLIPFADIQKEIMLKAPAKFRVILYRRFMMRIAEKIAWQEKAQAIVTGDALGQVASQTLENISAISEAVTIPILRPVIGFDKKEIIAKAQEIGAYDTSILPHEDCCSLFMPEHPETKAKLEEVKSAEEDLDIEQLVDTAINNSEID